MNESKDFLNQSWQRLLGCLNTVGKSGLALAFSGGVDSSLLALAAREAGLQPFFACTFVSPLLPESDLFSAQEIAAWLGVEHRLLAVDPLSLPAVAQNHRDRCYHCKKAMFQRLKAEASSAGIFTLADGSNREDLLEYRPGNQAGIEMGVVRPLALCGLGKREIRALAQEAGLPNANRTSSPCLASRFPYDTPLRTDALTRVDRGERYLRKLGFSSLRLRAHGDLARIEVLEAESGLLFAQKEQISAYLRELGFSYITLDLEGLIPGRFDRESLTQKKTE